MNILTQNFWLETNWLEPNPILGDFIWGYLALVFFIILLLIPQILKASAVKNKYLKKSIKKRLWPFLVFGVFGLLLVLIRFAEIEVLSRRIYLLVVSVLALFVGTYLFYKILKDYKKRLNSVEREKGKK